MSRHVISYEGVVETFDQTILLEGSVQWPETRVPLLWNFEFSKPTSMLGWAKDFQREETGEITAELDFTNEHASTVAQHDPSAIYATIYAKEVAQQVSKGVRTVHTCKITAVSLCIAQPGVGWTLETKVGERNVQ